MSVEYKRINTRIDKSFYENNKGFIKIYGWVNSIRKIGSLIFIDLRDSHGIIQIKIQRNESNTNKLVNINFEEIHNKYSREDVISVNGELSIRESANKEIYSGELEIIPHSISLISKANTTPLIVKQETDALEEVRSKYRYIDLRRLNMSNNIYMRSKIVHIIRDFFHNYKEEFLEVETPYITKPSFGGADELKVTSKNFINKRYSLTQSPQIYKQLLMYSGVENYFQIAKCFRDEDFRSDRQFEFTQLDIEMSYVKMEDIFKLIIDMFNKIFKINFFTTKLEFKEPTFIELKYHEAIKIYGSDKPDLRLETKLYDLSNEFKDTKINFIREGIQKGKKLIFYLISNPLEKSTINKLTKNNKKISWFKLNDNKIVDGNFKLFDSDDINKIIKNLPINNENSNSTFFFSIDEGLVPYINMGLVRNMHSKVINLNPYEFKFVFIKDWPLLELSENGILKSVHNPFTSPSEDSINKLANIDECNFEELLKLKSKSYDLVLNGYEIGGGSIRISDKNLQQKIFKILGLTDDEISRDFGWFIEAMSYGIPRHGGIALGIDRLLFILLNQKSIRDVIAFPKTTHGTDEMMGGPI